VYFFHDQLDDCFNKRIYKEVGGWTEKHIEDESAHCKERANVHNVFLEGKVLNLRNGLSKVKSDREANIV
jgi:hypothetical protein